MSTVVDWELARRISRATSMTERRIILIMSLGVNLGALAYFKYAGLLIDTFIESAALVGIEYRPPEFDIILPVGISFYTFQTLSYTIDVYRRTLNPERSFVNYALFVSFFPQLVAGPIVRARDFLPQTIEARRADPSLIAWGTTLAVLGLFEKIVIADSIFAPVADAVFDSAGVVTPLAAGIGTLAFAGQVFCDFAGYSTIAIGLAMCLGFALPDNFRFPYGAVGFSDFWRRWHISLSSWLRDYLYISLGGNRHGSFATVKNLMLTMLLGGLWHGASWTFIAWGGLHGFYLVGERWGRARFGHMAVWRTNPARIALSVATFALVCLAWVFFRAPSFDKAFEIVLVGLGMVPAGTVSVTSDRAIVVATVCLALVGTHWFLRDTTLEAVASRLSIPYRVMAITLMLLAIALSPGEDRAFIYFQF